MLELLYPMKPARVIPALGSDGSVSRRLPEMLPIVEPDGEVIAQSPRDYVHGGSRILHPVVHLHILNRFGQIYLQKRAMTKDFLPGMWDTAVGGHICYGESAAEALYREASEEVGLRDFNPIQLTTYIWETVRERELVFVYAAIGSFELHPDNFEVDEGRWWTDASLKAEENTLTDNFKSEYNRIRGLLTSLL